MKGGSDLNRKMGVLTVGQVYEVGVGREHVFRNSGQASLGWFVRTRKGRAGLGDRGQKSVMGHVSLWTTSIEARKTEGMVDNEISALAVEGRFV
jgi:hypothetical protein